MGRLVTKGNLAIFQYPAGANNPDFELQKDGSLCIFGYSMNIGPHPIGVMRRFEINLNGYQVVGKYDIAKSKIQGDYSELLAGLDTDNCVIMIKTIQP